MIFDDRAANSALPERASRSDLTGSQRPDPLATVRERLLGHYGSDIDSDCINQSLETAYDSLRSQATILTYLPLLAERAATAALERMLHDSKAKVPAQPTSGPSDSAHST
jgi:hypothetical protein